MFHCISSLCKAIPLLLASVPIFANLLQIYTKQFRRQSWHLLSMRFHRLSVLSNSVANRGFSFQCLSSPLPYRSCPRQSLAVPFLSRHFRCLSIHRHSNAVPFQASLIRCFSVLSLSYASQWIAPPSNSVALQLILKIFSTSSGLA